MFLPGLFGSSIELATSLAPKNVSILTIDYIADGNYQNLCDELVSIIKHYSTNYSIHITGYSMGGRVIVSSLPSLSKFVQSITLIACGLPITDPKSRYQKYQFEQLALKQLQELSASEFCRWWYSLPLYYPLSDTEGFSTFIHKRAKQLNIDHHGWLLTHLSSLKMSNNLNELATLSKIPLLTYMVGEHDKKYCKIALRFNQLIPNISIKTIKNSGHLCW